MQKIVYKNNATFLSKVWRNYKNIILQASRAINKGIVIVSKCAVRGDKNTKFIEKQEAKGLLNNPVIRTLLSKIPMLRDILF